MEAFSPVSRGALGPATETPPATGAINCSLKILVFLMSEINSPFLRLSGSWILPTTELNYLGISLPISCHSMPCVLGHQAPQSWPEHQTPSSVPGETVKPPCGSVSTLKSSWGSYISQASVICVRHIVNDLCMQSLLLFT